MMTTPQHPSLDKDRPSHFKTCKVLQERFQKKRKTKEALIDLTALPSV
jgi:hypothetical protein